MKGKKIYFIKVYDHKLNSFKQVKQKNTKRTKGWQHMMLYESENEFQNWHT